MTIEIRIWSYAAVTALLLFAACSLPAAEHSPAMDKLLSDTPTSEPIAAILFLDNRLTMDEIYPVARSLPMSERRAYVVDALQRRFNEMSPSVMTLLSTEQKTGNVTLLRPLWVMNAIRVTATRKVFDQLDATLPEVIYMASDGSFTDVLDTSWSVLDIGADQVWAQLGADGSGVVVGHKDSGVDWDHPGFVGHIWVNPGEDLNHNGNIDSDEINNIDDDGNGYVDDFRGWNFDDNDNDVYDGQGHGTKTASIISSNPTPCGVNSVAPGAKLMILRGIWTQGAGFEASQYAIQMGANVISQSFSFKQNDCDEYRDCPNYVAHRWVSEMELAGGIIHANSVGNDGLSNAVPLSVAAPANCPPPAMTPGHEQQGGVSSVVGVSAYYQGEVYYSASGHGPSGWSRQDICAHGRVPFCGPAGSSSEYPPEFEDYPYHNSQFPGLAKPDICAPSNSPSLSNGGGCASINATSGATPHVGGTLALIYSKFPGITPEDAYLLLVNSAADSGIAGYDSLWGFGRLRAFAACSLGVATRALVTGTITDGSANPLPGVRVSTDSVQPIFSHNSGHYELNVSTGQHVVLYEKFGYHDLTVNVESSPGEEETQNVTMQTAAAATAFGLVVGGGSPLADMPISIPEISLSGVTDAGGQFNFGSMFEGTYDFVVGDLPWETRTFTVTLAAGSNQLQFDLQRSPRAAVTGPDQWGYYIYDMFDAAAVTYDWVEINPQQGGEGESLGLTGDNSVVRALPFTSMFYGQSYNSITIAANGMVMMGSTATNEWAPWPIPRTEAPNAYVAPYFTDWVPQDGGGVYFRPDSTNHRVVIEWYNVPDFFGIIRATFELVIYEPGWPDTPTGDSQMKSQYAMVNGRFEGSVGLESPTGADGLQYEFTMFYEEHASPITAGRALVFTTTPTLAADDHGGVSLPAEFSLEPNYPNPFNPSTTFAWNVPRATRVRLALYDVLGRESAVVFDGVAEAGHHETVFAATGLPTGVYFARLETGAHSLAIRKVLLLK
jgi:hypothetical protein